jgi:hypothetical protein
LIRHKRELERGKQEWQSFCQVPTSPFLHLGSQRLTGKCSHSVDKLRVIDPHWPESADGELSQSRAEWMRLSSVQTCSSIQVSVPCVFGFVSFVLWSIFRGSDSFLPWVGVSLFKTDKLFRFVLIIKD